MSLRSKVRIGWYAFPFMPNLLTVARQSFLSSPPLDFGLLTKFHLLYFNSFDLSEFVLPQGVGGSFHGVLTSPLQPLYVGRLL